MSGQGLGRAAADHAVKGVLKSALGKKRFCEGLFLIGNEPDGNAFLLELRHALKGARDQRNAASVHAGPDFNEFLQQLILRHFGEIRSGGSPPAHEPFNEDANATADHDGDNLVGHRRKAFLPGEAPHAFGDLGERAHQRPVQIKADRTDHERSPSAATASFMLRITFA